MKNKLNYIAIAFFAISITFTACKGKEQQVDIGEITNDTLSQTTKANIELLTVNIPSPLKVTQEINKAGFSFNKGLINSVSKASSYTSTYQMALNMGVYAADLGYVTAFNQSQEVMEYLARIGKLSEGVGVSNAFDEDRIKGITENIGNQDTVTMLINEALEKAEKNFRSHERVSALALMITGGWVEGLYVTAQTVKDSVRNTRNENLYMDIWNHVYAFNYLIKLLEEYQHDQNCAQLMKELEDIKPLLLTPPSSKGLNNDYIVKLNEKLVALRSKIVG